LPSEVRKTEVLWERRAKNEARPVRRGERGKCTLGDGKKGPTGRLILPRGEGTCWATLAKSKERTGEEEGGWEGHDGES